MGLDFLHHFAAWHTCCQARYVPQKVPQELAWHMHYDLCFESHGVSPLALASHTDVCDQHMGASYQILRKAHSFIHEGEWRTPRAKTALCGGLLVGTYYRQTGNHPE